MNDDHIQDLKGVLSLKLLGTSYVPAQSRPTPEHSIILGLASQVRSYDSGEIGMNTVREAFARAAVPGFDFSLWLSDQVARGVYDPSVHEDDPDDWG